MTERPTRSEVMATLTPILGPEVSAVLLEAIPPYDWHEIVTKRDLDTAMTSVLHRFDALEARWEARFDSLEHRIDSLEGRIDSLEGRIDSLEGRIDSLDDKWEARFAALDGRFDGVEGRLTASFRQESARLTEAFHAETSRMLRWSVGAVAAATTAIAALVGAVAAFG